MEPTPSNAAPRPVVLVVDDEQAFLGSLSAGLEGEFEIETARTADEAEPMMARRSYDVVVCDHVMPGEQGLAFLSRARARYPRTRRILVTGYMNPEVLVKSMELAGLSACILKPMHTAELAEAIRTALKKQEK